MNKYNVSIITYYCNSYNYGGILQAYSLVKIIEKIPEFTAYQLTYNNGKTKRKVKNFTFFKLITNIRNTIVHRRNKTIKYGLNRRREQIDIFREQMIKHTSEYNFSNIEQSNDIFDIFICGSDQVWNPYWPDDVVRSNYYLTFACEKKIKIAYAASIGQKELTKKQLEYAIPKIKRLDYISVREQEAKDILQPYIDKEIKVVLDPTLLLAQEDWDKIATESDVKEPYIFVYLLGNNKEHRAKIKHIAKGLNLKIVFLPHIHFQYEPADENFADIDLYDVGPAEFVGLIKNANMVITDSFHGCVFSIIYHKKFWALKRHKDTEKENMNSRLYTLFGNLGLEERLLDDDQQLTKDELLKDIDYEAVDAKLEVLRKDSMDFLEHALSESVKMIEKNKQNQNIKGNEST